MKSNSTDTKDIQRIGIVAFIFFGNLCTLDIWKKKPIPTYHFSFLFLIGIVFALALSRFGPIYYSCLKFTHFIGRIWTILILVLIYYLVITPSAHKTPIGWIASTRKI
jgi:hypothetical protein